MKKHLDKIFLILGFVGTMLCTSYTVYSNINKFNNSMNKMKVSNLKKEETDVEFDDAEEVNDE